MEIGRAYIAGELERDRLARAASPPRASIAAPLPLATSATRLRSTSPARGALPRGPSPPRLTAAAPARAASPSRLTASRSPAIRAASPTRTQARLSAGLISSLLSASISASASAPGVGSGAAALRATSPSASRSPGASTGAVERLRVELEQAHRQARDRLAEVRERQQLVFRLETQLHELHRALAVREADTLRLREQARLAEEQIRVRTEQVRVAVRVRVRVRE